MEQHLRCVLNEKTMRDGLALLHFDIEMLAVVLVVSSSRTANLKCSTC